MEQIRCIQAVAGFGRLATVEADRRQGASKVENYGRGPWQEGLRNSTLYITLVALQYKCILGRRTYAKSYRGIRPTTTDINGRKKEVINPISYLFNYFQRLGSMASLTKLYSIYTKSRYKWSL